MIKSKSYLITLTITLIFSCNNVSKQDQFNEENTNRTLLDGEWTDGSGDFSIIYMDSNKIMAFDTFILISKINDSLYSIHYPKEPMILNAKFDSNLDNENHVGDSLKNNEWINFGLQTNYYDSRTKEIILGADRLKFIKKKNNTIMVYFPSESIWKVRKTKDGIDIFNDKNSKTYHRFID